MKETLESIYAHRYSLSYARVLTFTWIPTPYLIWISQYNFSSAPFGLFEKNKKIPAPSFDCENDIWYRWFSNNL